MSPGVVQYTPAPHFHGYLTIEYAVSDALGALDKGAVIITVSPVDDPPRPGDDSAEVARDGVTTISFWPTTTKMTARRFRSSPSPIRPTAPPW